MTNHLTETQKLLAIAELLDFLESNSTIINLVLGATKEVPNDEEIELTSFDVISEIIEYFQEILTHTRAETVIEYNNESI